MLLLELLQIQQSLIIIYNPEQKLKTPEANDLAISVLSSECIDSRSRVCKSWWQDQRPEAPSKSFFVSPD